MPLVCLITHVTHAAKLMVINGAQRTPRVVTVVWKDGFSGDIPLRDERTEFSSPWNRDIVGVRWYDIINNFPVYYDYPLHVSAVRPPWAWAKDARLTILDNGYVRFDIGKGPQEGKALSDKERKKLEKKGWEVID